tara:strand:+ start:676 stop:1491 length:816 start_codon:yes stop_codon:yes gene_type:complete
MRKFLDIPSPDKNLGQHYLNNKATIEVICNDFAGNFDGIIEVGPGPATLTKTLVSKNLPTVLIEKDTRFQSLLTELGDNIALFQEDALEFNIDQIFNKFPGVKNWWLVSNLPYNVGTPIMLKYLKHLGIGQFTLMFQKEVAQKACIDIFPKKIREKEMNSLHSLVANYFEVTHLIDVPPGHFSPPPKVDSAVISLKRLDSPIIPLKDWNKYEKFLRLLFGQRRKQIGKILKQSYSVESLALTFEKLDISSTIRSERLTLAQVQSLFLNLGR